MDLLLEKHIQCPCCGEVFAVLLDLSTLYQEYVEDCYVCCRPIIFTVHSEGGELIQLDVRSESK